MVVEGSVARADGAAAWLERPDGERWPVEAETRIGRAEGNQVRLQDPNVSRSHAVIRRSGGHYVISDLGSANGTYLNDEPVVQPRPLAAGDRIRVATWELVFGQAKADMLADQPAEASFTQFLKFSGTDTGELNRYVQGDLRVVTVLFLDIHGYTALSETMTPDQVTLVMNQCFERLTNIAAYHGGHVDKYVGDAMMVLFGAPVAHEDDAERAVRAALGMQDELRQFSARLEQRTGKQLAMRVGVNTGEVLAGRVGAGQFGQFTVMGDAVNLASRLEHAARVGHVLVGEATYRLTRHAFHYAPLAPMEIKGKRVPVQTYEVVGLDEDATDNPFETDFLGHEAERAALRELLADASAGLRVVVIGGEPGVGKSRLLAEAQREHLAGTHWAGARSLEYESHVPYAVLRRLAQELVRRAGPTADAALADPAWDVLRRFLAARPGAAVEAEPLAGAMSAVVERLASERLGVFALDEIQWADAESLALLDAALAAVGPAAPVALMATARPGWQRAWPVPVREIALRRLSREDTERLLAALLDGAPAGIE